jgi:hypothetical protein
MKTNTLPNPTSGTAAQYAQNLQLLADRQYIDRRVNIGQTHKTKPTPPNSTTPNIIYPNPTSGVAYINNPEAIEQVIIYDIHGKQQLKIAAINNTIALHNLASGIYIAQISLLNGTLVTQKVVINK